MNPMFVVVPGMGQNLSKWLPCGGITIHEPSINHPLGLHLSSPVVLILPIFDDFFFGPSPRPSCTFVHEVCRPRREFDPLYCANAPGAPERTWGWPGGLGWLAMCTTSGSYGLGLDVVNSGDERSKNIEDRVTPFTSTVTACRSTNRIKDEIVLRCKKPFNCATSAPKSRCEWNLQGTVLLLMFVVSVLYVPFSVPSTQYHTSHNLSGRWLDSTLLNQGHAFAACYHVASLLYWDVVRGPSFPSRQIVT